MRRGLTIAVLFALPPVAAAAAPPKVDTGVWIPNPALSDEFNGVALDSSKWRPTHAWWVGRPPSKFVSSNVSVSDGLLHLKTSTLSRSDQTDKVTIGAACISSLAPIAGQGYYEARIKNAPMSVASAFFLQRKDGQEIDIAENYGGSINSPFMRFQARSNTHWFPHGYTPAGDTHSIGQLSTPNTDWHIYGVWFKSPTEVAFYVDDRLVSTQTLKGSFAKPMFMFIDTEISTDQGVPSAGDLADPQKNQMLIDWVRSYTIRAR